MTADKAVLPDDESGRLAALRRYDVLDSEPEEEFDEVTRIAAAICNTAVSLVSLVDHKRQWFKSKCGTNLSETARDVAFCSRAIQSDGFMEVRDALQDERFRNNPLVVGPPNIRYYCGAPLVTPDGYRIGTLCVIDTKPGELNELQREALRLLARKVMYRLELRRVTREAEIARSELAAQSVIRDSLIASQKLSESFMRATIDAMTDNIAIVNGNGEIVHVNDSWQSFADENGNTTLVAKTGPGANYLKVCDQAAARGCADGAMVAASLRDILRGKSDSFELEYPCHAPSQKRWFDMAISAFGSGPDRHAVVTHRNVTERYQADQAIRELNESLEVRVADRTAELKESEQRFRSIFTNAQLGTILIDQHCAIEGANDAFLALTRRKREELIGRPVEAVACDSDREAFAELLAEICSGEAPGGDLDFRLKLPDGATLWIHASVSAIRDDTGRCVQALALIQDISGRKDAERQRDRFFDQSVDMMVIGDVNGRLHRVNPACKRILGYNEDELLNMRYLELVHPDDYESTAKNVAAFARGENVALMDVRVRTKSGDYRDIRWNASPWTAEGLVLAIGRDVTQILAAERAIAEKADMLARAEQMSQMGSLHWDSSNDTIACSKGLLWIAGLTDDNAPESLEDLASLFVAEERYRVRTAIARAAERQQTSQQLLRVCRPDGSVRVVQSVFSPTNGADRGTPGVTAAFRDSTDFSETIARLRESQRELRALTKRTEEVREEERAGISREIHDELGQMLTALKIDITLLARDFSPDKNEPPLPEAVVENLGSMEELVNSIIASVRRIAQRMRPDVLDSFGLVPAIEWHAGEFEKRTQIRCNISAPSSHPELPSDVRTALFRIVQEAMTNVARHAEADNIDIAMNYSNGTIELSVSDNGRGIAPERMAGTRSLGLLGMRERATMVGGTLKISGRDQRGTTVRVRLPVGRPDGGGAAETASGTAT